MPRICHSERDLSRPRLGRSMGTAWYVWISIGRQETACGQLAHVRLLPATTRSSRKVVTRIIPIPDAGRQVWNQAAFVMDQKLIILVQGHGWLYNLKH
jgi:hypothetical protein